MNLSELWQNGSSDLASASGNTTSPVSCQTATKHDLNTTKTASQVIVASCTGLFYLAILTLSVLGVWIQRFARLCSSRGTFFVFLIGALLASVNVFTTADNFEVKLYFRSFKVPIVGIAFAVFGAALFFQRPRRNAIGQTFGRHQPSMQGILLPVTFFLLAIEIFLLVLSVRKSAELSWETSIPRILVIIDKLAFLVQKPVQMFIYLYLRSTIARVEYRENARFYFRIISFFNLIEWVDSQVNVDSDIELCGSIPEKLARWFNILAVLYKALIIDYRLLCCLLFLENSMEISETEDIGALEGEGDEGSNNNNMTPQDQLKSLCGVSVGFTCLTAPVFCILYYSDSLQIGPSVQILAIVVNLVILISGVNFLRRNNLEEGEIGESTGVKIMVSHNFKTYLGEASENTNLCFEAN